MTDELMIKVPARLLRAWMHSLGDIEQMAEEEKINLPPQLLQELGWAISAITHFMLDEGTIPLAWINTDPRQDDIWNAAVEHEINRIFKSHGIKLPKIK